MTSKPSVSATSIAWSAAIALVGASCALAALGPLVEHPARGLWLFAIAGLAWCAALGVITRSALSMRAVVAIAVVLRCAAFAAELELSGDVHRYVFEGLTTLSGRNPYGFAPDAPELAELRARFPVLAASVNHPHVPAAYPPVVQAIGVASAAIADEPAAARSVIALRAAFAAADLALVFVLASLLRRRGLDPRLALAWAWSPLVAFEFAGSGHFDSVGILALVVALHARSSTGGVAAFAAAVLVKIVPLAAWPSFARGAWLRRSLVLVALCAASVVPFLFLEGAGRGFLRGISEYGFRWESTSLVHRFVERAFAGHHLYDESSTDPRRLARLVELALWAAAVGWAAWRVRDPILGARIGLGAWIVLSPTLHPWYVAWLVPLAAFGGARAWIWLAAAAPLLYAPLAFARAGEPWREPEWLWPLVALPFFALLAVDVVRGRAALSRTSPPRHPARPR